MIPNGIAAKYKIPAFKPFAFVPPFFKSASADILHIGHCAAKFAGLIPNERKRLKNNTILINRDFIFQKI